MQSVYFSGVCECCFSENNLKSMMHPITQNGKIEIYSEMLLNCLSIQVIHKDYPGSQHLICEECIEKLRSSAAFQDQIINVQSKLHNFLDSTQIHLPSIPVDLSHSENTYGLNASENSKAPIESAICFPGIDIPINSSSYQINIKKENANGITGKKTLSQSISMLLTKIKSVSKNIPKVYKKQTMCRNIKSHSACGSSSVKISAKDMKLSKDISNEEPPPITKKSEEMCAICPICKDIFLEDNHLETHMALKHPMFTCDECGKSFPKKTGLNVHKQIHKEKIECKICDRSFNKNYITRHIRLHYGDNLTAACPFCPEKFKSYQDRNKHLAKLHNVTPKKYKCKFCIRTYYSSSHLSQHVRKAHMFEKKHSCYVCKRNFFSKTDLKYHLVKHTGVKEFECDICHKHFTKKYSLTEHKKVHEDTKEYTCSICDSTFRKYSLLKAHTKLHANLYKP